MADHSDYFRRRYSYALRLMVAGWFGSLLLMALSIRHSYTYAKIDPNAAMTRVLVANAQYQRATPDERRGILRRAYEIYYPKEWKSSTPDEQTALIEDTLKEGRPVAQLPPGYTEVPNADLQVPSPLIKRQGGMLGMAVGGIFSLPWLWYFSLIRLSELVVAIRNTTPL
ncbi:MAG TPA: hypothetical protein VMU16_00940 [Candidatus Binataceae bacterium]|nr:hypothetical protein [Candidatus Binataceae bacterium]